MSMLENKVVMDDNYEPSQEERKNEVKEFGYREFGTDVFVPEESAFDYAIERITNGTIDEKQEFEEWFYSSNWIKEE